MYYALSSTILPGADTQTSRFTSDSLRIRELCQYKAPYHLMAMSSIRAQLDEEIVNRAKEAFFTAGSRDASQKEDTVELRNLILGRPQDDVLSFITARAEEGDCAVCVQTIYFSTTVHLHPNTRE
eukprot:5696971-Pyramimonas_sp.AAC.2